MGNGAVTGGFSGLGGATGSITIDTSQLASVRNVARQVGQDVQRSFGQIDQASQRTERSVGQMVASFSNLGTVVGSIVGARIVQVGFQLAETAARADRTRAAFNSLAAGAGQSGEAMLSAMRRASRGMVADADLVLAANQAMLLGVSDSAEEMGQLLEIARVRGEAMGLSTTQAFSDIVRGIGRLSPLILDNLGIVTDADNTYARYAESLGRTADSLTDAEKRQALLNRVINDSQSMLAAQGNSAESNAQKFEKFSAALGNARKAVGDFILAMGLPEAVDTFTRAIEDSTRQIETFIRLYQQALILMQAQPGEFLPGTSARSALNARLAAAGGLAQRMGAGADIANPRVRPGIDGPAPDLHAADRRAAQLDFARQLVEIEKQAGQQRTDAARQFAQQRAETVSDYERSIARESEDFGRQRLRAVEQFERQIASVQEESARRAAKWAEDLAERIADLQADSTRRLAEAQNDSARRIAEAQEATNKRIGEIERDYHRNRERAERDHRDRLMDAAARLDAVAVFNEQRQFRRQQQDAEQQHRERIDKEHDQLAERERKEQESLAERTRKEQESLQERIAQEQRAHAKRLAEAKEADERRSADMRADFARRLAEEDADRAVRLRRMAEDHQAQLAQQAAAHAQRIAQINQHEAEERRAAEDAHLTEMQRLGGTVAKGWLLVQEAIQKAMLESYDKFQEELNKRFATQGPQPAPQFPVNPFRGFADGGPVMRTGPANLHAGEFVLSRSMLAAINSATAGRVGQFSAMMGGPSLTLASGAIVVNAAAGQSEELIGQVVVNKLAAHYRSMGAQ